MSRGAWALLGATGTWWLVKGLTWGRVTWEQAYLWGALTNWALLMALAVLSATWARLHRIDRPDWLSGWKSVARPVVSYALLAGAGMGIWYGFIQQEDLVRRKQRALDLLSELKDPERFAQWKQDQGVDERMTFESFAQDQRASIDTLYSAPFFVGMSLLVLVFTGLVISLVVTWWWRNVLGGNLTSSAP
jgi:hypothetical protein